jgi:hypothetical protein
VYIVRPVLRAARVVWRPAKLESANYRVNYTIKGGTLERTYADGKKEKVEVKAGMTRYLEPAKTPGGKYTNKNIGTTDIVSYVVLLKSRSRRRG